MTALAAVCYYCLQSPALADEYLLGPRSAPCEACRERMATGVILICCPDEDFGLSEPRRLGVAIGAPEAEVARCFAPDLAARVLGRRWAFVPFSTWRKLGLPDPGLLQLPES